MINITSTRILAVLLLAASLPAMAQSAGKKPSYDAYRMVRSRNIFDPDRRPNSPMISAKSARSYTPDSPADFIALTGILVNGEKALAFFSNSRHTYNKVLSVKGKVAGAVILKINDSSIEVDSAGKRLKVAVGQIVPSDGSEPKAAPSLYIPPVASYSSSSSSLPSLTGSSSYPSSSAYPTPSSSSSSSASDAPSSFPTPSAAVSTDKEAILRRMMEKRQQELK